MDDAFFSTPLFFLQQSGIKQITLEDAGWTRELPLQIAARVQFATIGDQRQRPEAGAETRGRGQRQRQRPEAETRGQSANNKNEQQN